MFILVILSIVLAAALLVVLVTLFFLVTTLWAELSTLGKPSAPFVPLSRESLAAMVKYIHASAHPITGNSVVYDLGCGDGRVLVALQVVLPASQLQASFVGVERNLWAYMVARIKTRKLRVSRQKSTSTFTIVLGNIFNQDLRDATHITTYLFPKPMDALLPKIQSEVRPGTMLYSVDFKFSHKETKDVVSIGQPHSQLGRTLYVYEF